MSEKRKYQIELDAEQLKILQQACELVSRLGTGQWRTMLDYLPIKKYLTDAEFDWESYHKDVDTIGKILAKYTTDHVDGWTSSLGIYNKNLKEHVNIAWDLYQVFRQRLAWDRAHDNGEIESNEINQNKRNWKVQLGVDFDEPMQSSKIPFAKVKNV